jgi:5-hydroxyisourate hydrolase
MSQLSTHVLDTSIGKPAVGISIVLFYLVNGNEKKIAAGITNEEGRILYLLNKDQILEPGSYKLKFETKKYFEEQGVQTFYPFVEIVFTIAGNQHYHVPLLLNPFGYSTYRGS